MRETIKRVWAIAAAAVLTTVGASANQITDNITVKGGTVVEDGNDVVITYTAKKIAEDGEGSLVFKFGRAEARVLAIGGGGGGGGVNQTLKPYGGAGGGGAGGFVDISGLPFAGAYSIYVGRGGAGALAKEHAEGADGENTTVQQNGVQVSGLPIAYGGGGGGAGASKAGSTYTGAGRPGGSGGGGSVTRTGTSTCTLNPGGTGVAGQGHDGGAPIVLNTAYRLGGGGGGAGKKGGDISSFDQEGGAPGGDGLQSNITGSNVWYAGGGAGGNLSSSSTPPTAAGGLGGGGNSGNGSFTESRDGEDGKGGGGGGGSYTVAAGKGGDGVVIIRLTNFVGKIQPPSDPEFTYNGTEQVAATATSAYTLSGTTAATNAGTYIMTATLTDEGAAIGWADGELSRSREVKWTIKKMSIAKPEPLFESFTFTGVEQTAFAESEYYTFNDASNKATNAGEHAVRVTLNDPVNMKWEDDAATTRTDLSWTIAPKRVELPLARGAHPSLSYNGEKQSIFANPEWAWYEVTSGVYEATAADSYSCTVALKYNTADQVNVTWADGTSTTETWTWEILAKSVPVPEGQTVTYEEPAKGVAREWTLLEVPADADFSLVAEESAALVQTQAGTYTYTLALKDTESSAWEDGTTEPKVVTCTIEKATNAIMGLRMSGWRSGTTPKMPSVDSVRFGSLTTVSYSYSDSEEGPWDKVKLTDNGYHYVRASTPETANWSAAEAIVRYCVWADPADAFSDYVDITISGYSGSEELANLPVLVRLREAVVDAQGLVTAGLPGFTYARAGETGENIRFAMRDDSGEIEMLPFDIELWNTKGESLVWVKVPRVVGVSTTFRLYWHTDDPLSTNDPKDVWSDYQAVWHFNEEIASAEAATTLSKDATGHGFDAKAVRYGAALGSLNEMISVGGVIGNARQNASSVASRGTRFEVQGSADWVLGTQFTMSGWYNMKNSGGSGNQRLTVFARKSNISSSDGFYGQANSYRNVGLFGRGAGTGSATATIDGATNPANAGWTYFSYVYDNTQLRLFGGNNDRTGTGTGTIQAATDNGLGFSFGNLSGDQAWESFVGYFDEFRLAKVARSTDFQRAEYEAMAKADFLTYGLVNQDGTFVNYWTSLPTIEKYEWEQGELTEDKIEKGSLHFGAVDAKYVTLPAGTTTNTVVQTTSGSYLALFDQKPTGGDESYMIFGGPKSFTYSVIWHNTYDQLGGTGTGRILLGNDDTKSGYEITGQARYLTDENLPTYWVHSDVVTKPFSLPNIGDEITHKFYLNLPNGQRTMLWNLMNTRFGNTYSRTGSMAAAQNFLPWSTTSSPRTAATATLDATESSYFILENRDNAVIYSPCYTNGIGTIYFDAVNAYANDTNARLIIEYATETTRGDEPTDENCEAAGDPYFYLTHDAGNAELSDDEDMWQPLTPLVLKKEHGSDTFAVDTTQTFADNCVKLFITSGGANDAFYRVAATLNYHGAIRFRIRRYDLSGTATSNNQILLDNIIVSTPAMSANLSPVGTYDPDVIGKQTLGYACAFDVPFPSVHDKTVHGRARVDYVMTEGVEADPSTFIASATLHYRWRYLNQRFSPEKKNGEDQWLTSVLDHTAIQDGVLKTVHPLELNGFAGDLEWYYSLALQAPAYKYVDYTGLTFEKPTGDFSEELRAVTNHVEVASGDRLASGGTEWFLRLREGTSEWQGMQVVIKSEDESAQPIVGTYEMALTDDNMWRGFVVIPTNIEGRCTFSFRGRNRQVGSPTEIEENYLDFGVAAPDQDVTIPGQGTLVEDGNAVAFTIDHVAGYLEFTMSDKYLTYQIGRAEYQDFNYWNDAHTADGRFRIDSRDTNSVDIANMKISKAAFEKWPTFAKDEEDHLAWDEAFEVADYAPTTGRFVKEIFHSFHETPNSAVWTAQNITFVSENFVGSGSTEQKEKSGMAGKLLGSAQGLMDFSSTKPPLGIESIEANVRLGQSLTFDAVTYNKAAFDKSDYVFFVPVTMSHQTKADGSEPGDMAVGASVSLIGYHSVETGCYEVRVERLFSGKHLRISIWKWKVTGQQWSCQRLAWNDRDMSCWSKEAATTETQSRKYHGFFISFKTDFDTAGDPTKTRIICGLSEPSDVSIGSPVKNFNADESSTINWNGIIYDDTDHPYGWGCYGVVSKDCPAQFVVPVHYDTPLEGLEPEAGGAMRDGGWWFHDKKVGFGTKAPEQDRNDVSNRRCWAVIPGRCEAFLDASVPGEAWRGLHAPTNLTQNLELFLKKRGQDDSNWQKVGTMTATSYNFAKRTCTLRRPGEWDVRLRTAADKAIDVVVDDVSQYKWQAEDVPVNQNVGSDFIYTQCVVERKSGSSTQHVVRMQPVRAEAIRPVSIRSPVLDGLGKITFAYQDVDVNAEVWVQVATNQVNGNLTGSFGYNESIRSVEFGEQQEIGEWITVAKYKYTGSENPEYDLKGSSSKSVYLGWHNHQDRPIKGIYRLFIPPAVVQRAVEAAAVNDNLRYGQLTITDLTCTDEPGQSERSWRSWNMRTIGNATDSEARMNLTDMKIEDGGVGLVAALNNSTSGVIDADGQTVDPTDARLRSHYPAIYSPTMKPANARSGVGSVSFKARLYSNTGRPETAEGGQIVIYGARDSRATEWDVLATNIVNNSVFSNFTWTAGNKLYTAIKLEISDPSAKTATARTDRIVLDEVVIAEKVPPTINFAYARPFRNSLFDHTPIEDILSPSEQPLAGESWGVQTQLTLQQLTDEIDVEKGFEVQLSYYRGLSPWGYEKWKTKKDAVTGIKLVQVGQPEDLIFRSIGETPKSLVEPSAQGGEIVQFMLTVTYYDRGGKSDTITMSSDWQQPDWFYPLDYNATNGAYDNEDRFAAYTVLDTVSPGRAWINEVNWNDGTKKENGGDEAPVNHQFVEICIPSGVDMTGWKLRMTDLNENQRVFAKFGDKGNNIPASKVSKNAVNGYEFFVLQSPETRDAGGIKRPGETTSAADATWYAEELGTVVENGTLAFGSPYQFELIRPSGVIEHQFVLDGTNTLSQWDWAYIYDGTNLVAKLNDDHSPKRFYAGHEVSRKNPTTFASVGVTGGENSTDTSLWPGGEKTWTEAMSFTPGALNEGQTIPKDWFLPANGTNSWVYLIVNDEHIHQKLGDETGNSILVVVPQGQTTNVTYTVDNWYEGTIRTNDVDVITAKTGSFTYAIQPSGTTYVTASAVPQASLAANFGLDEKNPYTPAILKWLETEYGEYSAEDLRLAYFLELPEAPYAKPQLLSLTDMYWLDIPPVPKTEAERMTNAGTNYWLRAGITKMGSDHYVYRTRNGIEVTYTNKQIEVTMYVSNACTQAVWAPKKLQGLNNESSATHTGVWTGPTLKISGKPSFMAPDELFMPFRLFCFSELSFGGSESDKPYRAVIDILDPFMSPIGRNYGWDKYPNREAYFKWSLDAEEYPFSTEKLKADSTYPERLEPETTP